MRQRLARLSLVATTAVAAAAPIVRDPISADRLMEHIRVLASDEFEGRAPGTAGEEKTVEYLVRTFRDLGLEPGNPDGTYIQEVPLVGTTTRAEGTVRIGDSTLALDSADAWVPTSRRPQERLEVEGSDLVFVGYGVVAPEYGWDDYKGLDCRGKTLVMLVNDPPVPDPDDPSALDDSMFKGRAMTYYGRWTYKFEIASEKGADAVLLIHETGPAGYPYEVIRANYGREHFDIASDGDGSDRVRLESWIALETAQALLKAAGQDLDALKAAAARPDFEPVPLGVTLDATIQNDRREVRSRNVLARRRGTDLADQTVIYTAHWDHLGRDDSIEDGDAIYNGAADNASGVAALLEIARAFVEADAPRRSILFLAVTAEEQGLLGAKYYATHPLYPLETTAAVINMDVINLWGRTEDVTSVGLGQSSLDDLLIELAGERGRRVIPDPEPEKGLYYRSDHFEFAKVGIPALNAKGGMTYIGKPADYGQQKRDEYTRNDYHKPSDEIKPDWDLSGAVEDAELLYVLGRRVADADELPTWKPDSEFRARREAMLENAAR